MNQTKRYLSFNIKNECTTVYYLFLKKQFRKGEINPLDICSDNFNQQLINQPKNKKKKHHSIDFNALVEKIEEKKVTDTANRERKCLSQVKQLQIDMTEVGRQSCEGRDWDHYSSFH